MNIRFIDLNKTLVEKVKEIGIESIHGSVFDYQGVIVSASNPWFSFGGGLDYQIFKHYQEECALKQKKVTLWGKNGNERIGNVIFCVTVDRYLKATPALISKAIIFAIRNTKPNEQLLISGLGCGIGGLSENIFIKILKQSIEKYGKNN